MGFLNPAQRILQERRIQFCVDLVLEFAHCLKSFLRVSLQNLNRIFLVKKLLQSGCEVFLRGLHQIVP